MSKKGTRRSQAWFGPDDKDGFIHRSWMRNQGYPSHMFDGRPVIGICNTWSELTPCNAHFRRLADYVKRGVYEAGGFPVEFPVTSTGETMIRPTAMFLRNLVSMDVEESIRANPIDGVVLLTGCDKTTPALVMGAASCDLPTLVLPGGPMLNGHYRGQTIGSGTSVWQFSEDVRAGVMSQQDFYDAEACMSRSAGHCMTMGTASTMACMAEALGLTLPGAAAVPAVDSRRYVLAHEAGNRIVDMVKEDLKLSAILTRQAFRNAVRVNAAIGGSTNAVVHLLAIAGRAEVALSLDDWDEWGRDVPTLVNLMPSGQHLMEDFYYAGGLPAVMRLLLEAGLLDGAALGANGRSLQENVSSSPIYNDDVIRPVDRPIVASGGVAVLRGNLAPDGALIKVSAASERFYRHRGPALVFEDIDDYKARIDDPDLDVDETTVLVLKNCGPRGYPGMPEVGNMGLPPKLLKAGIRDMVRLSDARMSGTAFGTVVLHITPEAAVGGVLAMVRTGDIVELDVAARRLHLEVDDAELARRRETWKPPSHDIEGGYHQLYVDHVEQADRGADFDFLRGRRGAAVPRDSH